MKSMLIVSDDLAERRILKRTFGSHGWWIDCVGQTREAWNFLVHLPFDVLLIDWEAGGRDAQPFVQDVREQCTWSSMRIIVICGVGERDLVPTWGIDDHVARPFVQEDVLRTVSRWTLQAKRPIIGSGLRSK